MINIMGLLWNDYVLLKAVLLLHVRLGSGELGGPLLVCLLLCCGVLRLLAAPDGVVDIVLLNLGDQELGALAM